MPLIVSFLFLAISAMLVLLEADASMIWAGLLCNAGALAAFWAMRGAMPRAPRLAATAIVIVYLINYPLQAVLVDWLYHSTSYSALWRGFSLLRLDGSLEARADVFFRITAIFALMCSGMTFYAVLARRTGRPDAAPGGESAVYAGGHGGAQTLWMLLAAGLVVAVVCLLVQVLFGIGSLTSEAAFSGRLDGVLYHTLVTLVPLLFMAVHWEALRKGDRGLTRVSLAAYVLLALAEMSMMSSRGFVVLQMLPMLLLYLWMGRDLRRLTALAGATVLLTVLLYPVMTSVRTLRANSGYGAADSITLALASGGEARSTTADLIRMSARFIGYTSYLMSLERPDARFDWSELSAERIVTLRESGFTRWFTAEMAGYGRGVQRHFSSPGLLGAAQVLGGPTFVFVLPPLLSLLTLAGVQLLERRPTRLGPLVPVNLLTSLLLLMEEGVFDLIFTRLALVCIALFILNWLFRLSVPDHNAAGLHGVGYSPLGWPQAGIYPPMAVYPPAYVTRGTPGAPAAARGGAYAL